MKDTRLVVILFCALVADNTVTANKTVFRIGVILINDNESPYDLKRSGAAITLAFDKVNEYVLNGSYRIEPVMRSYGPKCDANEAPGRSCSNVACHHKKTLHAWVLNNA